ncbi:MAG: glutamine amidotransferase family protein [Candidatus Altiarchaeota archaeon]
MNLRFTQPPKNRVFDACGIAGLFNYGLKPESGKKVRSMIALMRERENGLGGGYAAYGLFPKMADHYCIQLLLEDIPEEKPTRERVEEFLKKKADIARDEKVPLNEKIIPEHPEVHRFFITPRNQANPDEDVKNLVMEINASLDGAFCMSSGKNMAVFKGNGWADEIGLFYKIDELKAYMWTAHSRFPTNTPGWWGGAHPFNILGHSVVHNGEITSYGTNVNYLTELGYVCTLKTDTEVVAYLFDYLMRKTNYPTKIAAQLAAATLAPPYWREIDRLPEDQKLWLTSLRMIHRKAMANGPFAIIITTNMPKPLMIGHTDRKKLRPLIGAQSADESTLYIASELNPIHAVDDTDDYWQANPGQPIIATTEGIISRGTSESFDWLTKKSPGGN